MNNCKGLTYLIPRIIALLIFILNPMFIQCEKPWILGSETSPKFNCIEKEYIQLTEARSCNGNFGNEFIFDPWSLCVDSNGDIVGIDRLSSKIFILDKELRLIRSFGKRGNAEGELSGYGYGEPVYLQVKNDLIYANDSVAQKVLVFDKKGRHKRSIKYGDWQVKAHCRPIVNNKGELLFLRMAKDEASIINEKKQLVGGFKANEEYYHYLFKAPGYLTGINDNFKSSLLLQEIMHENTLDDKLVIVFKPSATLGIYNLAKPGFKSGMKLRPRDALSAYEKQLKKIDNQGFKEMFFVIFIDKSESETFYLQFGKNIENGDNCIYEFDLFGKLIKVLYVKNSNSGSFVRFFCKKNDFYYGIENKNIKVFKEVK
ncbi:MAG: hypothetical protein MUP71_05265 [Candidatus Aminicenantes bacterium]|nr:hypothetical protein [Candidatus Aminicenantes bacterium]